MPTIEQMEIEKQRGSIVDEWYTYMLLLGLLKSRVKASVADQDETIKRIQSDMDSKTPSIEDQDQRDILIESYESELEVHEQVSERSMFIHMRSFFAVSYALFEHQLFQVCGIEQKVSSNPFS